MDTVHILMDAVLEPGIHDLYFPVTHAVLKSNASVVRGQLASQYVLTKC